MLAIYCVVFVSLALLMVAYLIYLKGERELAFVLRNTVYLSVFIYTFIVLFLG